MKKEELEKKYKNRISLFSSLSYSEELPKKYHIYSKIDNMNHIYENNGFLYLSTDYEDVFEFRMIEFKEKLAEINSIVNKKIYKELDEAIYLYEDMENPENYKLYQISPYTFPFSYYGGAQPDNKKFLKEYYKISDFEEDYMGMGGGQYVREIKEVSLEKRIKKLEKVLFQ